MSSVVIKVYGKKLFPIDFKKKKKSRAGNEWKLDHNISTKSRDLKILPREPEEILEFQLIF